MGEWVYLELAKGGTNYSLRDLMNNASAVNFLRAGESKVADMLKEISRRAGIVSSLIMEPKSKLTDLSGVHLEAFTTEEEGWNFGSLVHLFVFVLTDTQ